jgi:hypothetical protein
VAVGDNVGNLLRMEARAAIPACCSGDPLSMVSSPYTTRKTVIVGKSPATHLKSGVPHVYTHSARDIMRHA